LLCHGIIVKNGYHSDDANREVWQNMMPSTVDTYCFAFLSMYAGKVLIDDEVGS
jgi:hypothetical protein